METVRSLVLEAYGGRKLSDLTSISIKSDRRLAFPGSNYSPDLNEFVEDRYHFQIDLIGQRGSSERYIHQNGNIYHDRTTTTPNGLAEITYPLSRVTYKNGVDFYARFGAVFRLSDTLLAYTIATQPNRTKLATPSFFRA